MTNILKLLIKEELRRYLREQQATPPEPPVEDDATATPDMPDMDVGASADAAATPEGDLTGDATDVPGEGVDAGTEGGDIGGTGEIGPDGEPIEGEGEDDMGDLGDFGGGGGFSGGGGGGGGFSGGGGDDMGGDGEGDSGGNETSPPEEPKQDPNDPVGAVVEEAKEAAKKTIDPQQILNAVKAAIQVNFSDVNEAWDVVKELRATKDKTLANVADRLTLFIAGI